MAISVYQCRNCRHRQRIARETATTTDYCRGCSWRPEYQPRDAPVMYGTRVYHNFDWVCSLETYLDVEARGNETFLINGHRVEMPQFIRWSLTISPGTAGKVG